MRKNKFFIFIIIIIIIAAAAFFYVSRIRNQNNNNEVITLIHPTTGALEKFISTTGTVLPKNRLEIKPPVGGRIESILVQEGDEVKIGQPLAWMSSTERAALLDAARGKGEKEYKYWQDVYKPIPLLSPIDGQVIVATMQPGQTITTTDSVVVLSDRLIVRAQVDETDIGKISLNQPAIVTLDAYQETKIKTTVNHIYYESQTVNNVTIYMVDLVPEDIPRFFRSGMNATINFIEKSSENMLILPVEAIVKENNKDYVLVKQPNSQEPEKRSVVLGISDDKNVEIVSGLSLSDTVLMKTKKFVLPRSSTGSNPFMPFGGRKR